MNKKFAISLGLAGVMCLGVYLGVTKHLGFLILAVVSGIAAVGIGWGDE